MAALAKVRLENEALREDAERLRRDPAALEEAARRTLGLTRPGEVLVILKDAASPSTR
jgi:cell division protein FtsB